MEIEAGVAMMMASSEVGHEVMVRRLMWRDPPRSRLDCCFGCAACCGTDCHSVRCASTLHGLRKEWPLA